LRTDKERARQGFFSAPGVAAGVATTLIVLAAIIFAVALLGSSR
jgi:hypothetical protein